jgi:hypothetical protein
MIKSSSEAGGLTKIATQLDHGDPAVDSRDFTQHSEGLVGRAIIHENDFEALAVSLHNRFEAIVEIGDVFLLVM